MKTIGMVGGIGPESTIDYYRRLLAGAKARGVAGSAPIVMTSLDTTTLLGFAGAGNWKGLAGYLAEAVAAVARAGAEIAFLAANTPHVVFGDVRDVSPVPLVSIVEATCDRAAALGFRRVGILGTRFTMEGRFYPDVFGPRGIEVVAPQPDERDWVHAKYVGELVPGTFLDETRRKMLEIMATMRDRDDVEAVILGGTELPLLLRDPADPPVPFLDTTDIHVAAILDRAV